MACSMCSNVPADDRIRTGHAGSSVKMMMLMQAETSGEIVAIPAENGKPVTPGQVRGLLCL